MSHIVTRTWYNQGMRHDPTLSWMRQNLPENEVTLEAWVGLNWCGDKNLRDVCREAELVAELPVELVWSYLAFSPNASDLDVEDLVALRTVVDNYEDEKE